MMRWQTITGWAVAQTCCISQWPFWSYNEIQDGGWPPFWKTENRNNSAAVWAIVTKFGVVDMDSLQRAVTPFLTCMKNQDGGRTPSWILIQVKNGVTARCRLSMSTTPNLVTIAQTAAELLRFSVFQNGGRPPSWIWSNRPIGPPTMAHWRS